MQVVIQGILGASVGQKLLDAVGVTNNVARGVAIGDLSDEDMQASVEV